MWVFGYGSLIFDGWEKSAGCLQKEWAELSGFSRSFNKRSVESRGTPKLPGLTLNLDHSEGVVCTGVAFRFANDQAKFDDLIKKLARREACQARVLQLKLVSGESIDACVFIYEGKNLISKAVSVEDRAEIIRSAKGIRGSNFDYVRDIFFGLQSIGINDPEVSAIWNACNSPRQ
jgi:cation transport protein ChaC